MLCTILTSLALTVAVVIGVGFVFIVLIVLSNWSTFWKNVRLHYKHRRNDALYDNIWRRPDGVCVNDAGEELGLHFQEIHGRSKECSMYKRQETAEKFELKPGDFAQAVATPFTSTAGCRTSTWMTTATCS